ncbi:MAG: hypothetical protein WC935_07975 [Thermoleophilia bacterium]
MSKKRANNGGDEDDVFEICDIAGVLLQRDLIPADQMVLDKAVCQGNLIKITGFAT